MVVEDIIRLWLKANGYNGLCTQDCGCTIDDLAPCSGYCFTCEPGHCIGTADDGIYAKVVPGKMDGVIDTVATDKLISSLSQVITEKNHELAQLRLRRAEAVRLAQEYKDKLDEMGEK
jgi:hypothetical protein